MICCRLSLAASALSSMAFTICNTRVVSCFNIILLLEVNLEACHPCCVYSTINLIMYYTYSSHNTTILSMSDKQLHWVQLHVSALGAGHHRVVVRLIEQLYNEQGILGGVWSCGGTKSRPPPPLLPPVYPAYCIVAR